jgi:L-arabinose isomerase
MWFHYPHGLTQLPGIAVQRLMADGYGFAALVRAMKVMSRGLTGGTSFMEDYTYDFGSSPKVLGAQMLEVCPSIGPPLKFTLLLSAARPTRSA